MYCVVCCAATRCDVLLCVVTWRVVWRGVWQAVMWRDAKFVLRRGMLMCCYIMRCYAYRNCVALRYMVYRGVLIIGVSCRDVLRCVDVWRGAWRCVAMYCDALRGVAT